MSEHQLIPALETALRQLPGVETVRRAAAAPGWEAGLELQGESARQQVRLVVDFQRQLYPRDVVARVAQNSVASGQVPLVAAEVISPGARSLLQKHGVNYWESGSGSLFLRLPWSFYWLEWPSPAPVRRARQALFRGASTAVLQCLLLEPRRVWKVQPLAQQAQVAAGTVHQVFTALEERGYLDRTGRGPQTERHLLRPGQLLEEWSHHHSLRDYKWQRYFGLARSPAQLERQVEALLHASPAPYALTLEAGALRSAPLRTGPLERWSVLLEEEPTDELAAWVAQHGFQPVDEGGNLILLRPAPAQPAALRQRQQLGELWVANPVQLYLDLMALPQRGKEQARQVRAQILGY